MKKKTHDEYVQEIRFLCADVIETYINARTPILHRCKKCGHEWFISPDNLLRGYGCPCCAGVHNYSLDEFKTLLNKVNCNIIVVGEYVNAKTKIQCECAIDGHRWYAIPKTLLKGHGCPVCAGNQKKTHIEYVNDVKNINRNIEVIGRYINANTQILHRCLIDGHEWLATPNNILCGKGCPKCHYSVGEKQVEWYLDDHNIEFIPQFIFDECKNIKALPFDFYIPNFNLCIEYDGIQHFEPRELFGGEDAFKHQQHNDSVKTNYCKSNGIKLLRIRYDQDVEEELNNFFNNTKLTKEAV